MRWLRRNSPKRRDNAVLAVLGCDERIEKLKCQQRHIARLLNSAQPGERVAKCFPSAGVDDRTVPYDDAIEVPLENAID